MENERRRNITFLKKSKKKTKKKKKGIEKVMKCEVCGEKLGFLLLICLFQTLGCKATFLFFSRFLYYYLLSVSLSFFIKFIKSYDRIHCFYFAPTGPTLIFPISFGNKCYWIPFSDYIIKKIYTFLLNIIRE